MQFCPHCGQPMPGQFEARRTVIHPLGPFGRAQVDAVLDAVGRYYQFDRETLLGRSRRPRIHIARAVAAYLIRVLSRQRYSFPDIGMLFSNRDHTSMMTAVQKIENLVLFDSALRQQVKAVIAALGVQHELPPSTDERLNGQRLA